VRTIQGPGLFISLFIGTEPEFETLDGIARWAAGLGFCAFQVPTWHRHIFDLERAAESQAYCDDFRAALDRHGLVVSELACQRQGHLMAVHPAYDRISDTFAPEPVRGDASARQRWAAGQLQTALAASRRLGLDRMATFSGSFLWPYFYPYPPPPAELVGGAFAELAARWRPILDAAEENGVDLCFELHPGEDLHDGTTFERLLDLVDGHARCCLLYDPSHFLLQHMDYVGFIDAYHPRIKAFHVKDAEFQRSARTGVYGGYAGWTERAGRFRSLGDGQVDFKAIFSRLTAYEYDGWATLEWECCFKNRRDGAREGAAFIRDHIIPVTERSFDAGLRAGWDAATVGSVLGLALPPATRSPT
jgi:sugar phosphate isomerase/epimerase